MNLMKNPDTITALATPDGEGAISVIRLSGPQSLSILNNIFRLRKEGPGEMEPLRLYRGWIHDGDRDIDDLMVAVMEKPRSYTGEDMVEIYSHGGRVISAILLDLITSRGARLAEPGEFTRRAFLNGKMDLTRAESVAWLISARSEEELKSAVGQLGGKLRDRLLEIKADLIHALSLVEITLDFDEHEDHPVPYTEVRELISSARTEFKSIWWEARAGGCLHDGIRVVIVGKPNVGKSSLLNTFLSQKRAIVSTEPGTTRDTIEEVIRLEGIPLRLIDTAGIRQPSGEIEREGVKRARENARDADLVLVVLDSGTSITEDDLKTLELVREKPALLVINKTDLPEKVDLEQIRHELHRKKVVKISLARNWGIERLRKEIISLIREEYMGGNSAGVMISGRRRDSINEAVKSLDESLGSIERRLSGELIASDLTQALKQVKLILGEEYGDELLDEIFSRFCVGK
jgi:tRNA modification GTPase